MSSVNCLLKLTEAKKTLVSVSNDLFDLIQQFKDQPKITRMHSYKLLERILKEHCNLTISENETKIEIKEPKEIPSDSLQNTSDPDATYSGHKGHAPVELKKKKTRYSAAFDSDLCNTCPLRNECLAKAGKKYYYLRYTEKEMRIAKRRAYEQTEEFKDRYRWRAGV